MARAFYIAAGSRRIAFISQMRYMLQGGGGGGGGGGGAEGC